ncbi:hypothetical protein PoB_003033100 [Plakobranchus ocellatus]|uniref:Uncharacterized protein n=1 Tax=Plakobranchus ocellatus TaxID=259542 RepID=A0AAV4AB14_9GAST|nr:hypothetical protein PoB_003033100 [Plakobranchus ocellatus]
MTNSTPKDWVKVHTRKIMISKLKNGGLQRRKSHIVPDNIYFTRNKQTKKIKREGSRSQWKTKKEILASLPIKAKRRWKKSCGRLRSVDIT